MKEKISNWHVLMAGASICAIFFGSGNIVLPLIIGQETGGNWFSPYVGFIIGAVFIPILGLIAISLKDGSDKKFFSCIPNKLSIAIQFIILSILGPFAITPRCITVSWGGMKSISPELSLWVFSFIFCIILFFIAKNPDKIMDVIGKILTPIKLTLLISVVCVCLAFIPDSVHVDTTIIKSHSVWSNFLRGLSDGYQTTDLIGAIYTGTIIIDYVKKVSDDSFSKKELLIFGIKSAIVGALILMVLYYLFTILAVNYRSAILNVNKEDIFIKIADICMGNLMASVVGVTIIVSCFTTAVAILTIWCRFVHIFLGSIGYKISYAYVVFGSILITYVVSLLGLELILDIFGPVLFWIYPLLILITIYNMSKDIKEISNAR